jgi:predicted RNA binding protein YcfA (HicA-like mRNA interferase family)
MNLTAKQMKKVALKLGYQIKEGKKHLLVYSETGLVTTIPRGRIKSGTLSAIVKQMGINKDELAKLL